MMQLYFNVDVFIVHLNLIKSFVLKYVLIFVASISDAFFLYCEKHSEPCKWIGLLREYILKILYP